MKKVGCAVVTGAFGLKNIRKKEVTKNRKKTGRQNFLWMKWEKLKFFG